MDRVGNSLPVCPDNRNHGPLPETHLPSFPQIFNRGSLFNFQLVTVLCNEMLNCVSHVEQLELLLLVQRYGEAAKPINIKSALLA